MPVTYMAPMWSGRAGSSLRVKELKSMNVCMFPTWAAAASFFASAFIQAADGSGRLHFIDLALSNGVIVVMIASSLGVQFVDTLAVMFATHALAMTMFFGDRPWGVGCVLIAAIVGSLALQPGGGIVWLATLLIALPFVVDDWATRVAGNLAAKTIVVWLILFKQLRINE